MLAGVKVRKPKVCRVASCGASFVPARLGQAVCSPACGLLDAATNREKARKSLAEVGRKELRAEKERIKPKGQYMREAQAAFNAWVRERDAHLGCVSCDKPATWSGQWHASHFRSVGSSPEHRFNPANVHKACSICNNHLSGNILGFLPELERRIGAEAVQGLLGPSEPQRYTIEDLKTMTADYRARVRTIKKAANQ